MSIDKLPTVEDIARRIQANPTFGQPPIFLTNYQKMIKALNDFEKRCVNNKQLFALRVMSTMTQAELADLMAIPLKDRMDYLTKIYKNTKMD